MKLWQNIHVVTESLVCIELEITGKRKPRVQVIDECCRVVSLDQNNVVVPHHQPVLLSASILMPSNWDKPSKSQLRNVKYKLEVGRFRAPGFSSIYVKQKHLIFLKQDKNDPRLYKKSGNIFIGRVFNSLLVWIFHQLLLTWFVFTTMEQSGQNLKWRQPRCVSSLPISPPTCRHFPRNNRRHTSSLTKNQGVKNIKSFKISPVFWSTGGGKTIKIEMIEIDLTQKQSPLENSIFKKNLAFCNFGLSSKSEAAICFYFWNCNRIFLLHLLISNNFNILPTSIVLRFIF